MSEAQLIEVYPITASEGGNNAHYHFCAIRGASQNYAVCLHILKAREEDRIKKDEFVDCQRACLRNDCDAMTMREAERAAGHALYYTPRIVRNPMNGTRTTEEAQRDALKVRSHNYDMSNASYARGWAMAGGDKPLPSAGKPSVKPIAKPAAKKKSGYIEEGFADVVNAISADKPITPAKPATEALKPLPGETPLQFAKRRAQAMKGA